MKEHVIRANLDEMVFEGRESGYGGFDLRKRYSRHLVSALGLAMTVFIMGATLPGMLDKEIEAKLKTKRTMVTMVSLNDLPEPPRINEKEPPKPIIEERIPPPQRRTIEYKVPEPTPIEEIPIEEVEQTLVEIEVLDTISAGLKTQEGNIDFGFAEGDLDAIDGGNVPDLIVTEPDPPKAKPKEKDPSIDKVIFVQKEPEPINLKDIKDRIGYPSLAKEADIQGMVVVRILVDEYGTYQKHKVIKDIHPLLAQACEREVPNIKFTPAIQGGNPIKFWVNVPFRFRLQK